jgi:3-oxoacyl-[acyl-carrier-protein] synthase II
MSAGEQAVITGIGIEVPGMREIESLLSPQTVLEPEEFNPVPKLKRKGLLYKDRATKLALCAVQEALTCAGLAFQEPEQVASTSVVVSSNLGNVDTVCRLVETIRNGSVEDLSPLELPNASSNIIASTIAIRFGCRGINLMLCNGATSGIDALYTATNLIRAGRARRVLVVGVEPRNEVVEQLMAASQAHEVGASSDLQLGDGAACVVLEAASDAAARGARVYGILSDYCFTAAGSGLEWVIPRSGAGARLWLTPNQRSIVDRLLPVWEERAPEQLDLSRTLGEVYGALGIFQCVAACLWLQRSGAASDGVAAAVATAGGSWGDGIASIVISTPEVRTKEIGTFEQSRGWMRCAERTLDGQTLRVSQWRKSDSEAPATFMIHGLEEGSDIWLGLCQQLSDQSRLFGLDLPWQGHAGYRWGHVRPATEWLREGLALAPASPTVLIAHSFGANAVLEYLQHHEMPTLRAIVLVAPFYRAHYEDFDWTFFHQATEKFGQILEHGLRVRKGDKAIDPEVLSAMTQKVLDRVGPLGFMEFFSVFMRTPALRLDRIRVPVLVVGGVNDPGALPGAAALAQSLPDGYFELIPECGHFCMLEQPGAFETLVRRFVSERLGIISESC